MICVSLTTVMPVAEVLPKLKAVVPAKPEPVIVTLVPPAEGPLFGETPLITGGAFGVTELEAADALPGPLVLVAVTVKV